MHFTYFRIFQLFTGSAARVELYIIQPISPDYLLEEARVALVPGIAFGCDKYARLSYAVSMKDIAEGMDRIEEAIKNLL